MIYYVFNLDLSNLTEDEINNPNIPKYGYVIYESADIEVPDDIKENAIAVVDYLGTPQTTGEGSYAFLAYDDFINRYF
jgi:hypothetical protein